MDDSRDKSEANIPQEHKNRFIALMGIGYWGKNLYRDLNNLGVLKMVCEINDKLIKKYSKNDEKTIFTSNVNDILNDESITAVVIALPAEYHYKYAKLFLQNGKNVFVEKPLALEVSDGEELIKISKENNKILMVGHILRYHPCFKKIEEIVKNGDIGKLYYIESIRKNCGKIRQKEDVLWSFAPHDISLILSLVNNSKPINIKCFGEKHLQKEISDVTYTRLEFPDNCFAKINVSWLNPSKEQVMNIVGSNGMIIFDDRKKIGEKLMICENYIDHVPGVGPIAKKPNFRKIKCKWEGKSPLQLECEHFIDCCLKNKKPLTDGEEGLSVLKILNSCSKLLIPSKKLKFGIKKYFIHESADVDEEKTEIGQGTKIWRRCHIMGGKIGKNCSIGQNCFMASGAELGDGCKVQNNVSLYSGVKCKNNVFVGPSVVFTNDRNPRASFPKGGKYIETIIEDGVSIGANSTIVCGIKLGKGSFIGAGSVVTKNVEPYCVVYGNPARPSGKKMDEGGNFY